MERVLKLPLGPWPRDKHLQMIGNFELRNWREQATVTYLNGCENNLGGDQTYYRTILKRAEDEVINPNIHTYMPFYVVYGRKPLDAKPCGPQPEESPDAHRRVWWHGREGKGNKGVCWPPGGEDEDEDGGMI
ncbi:hypothetical protein ACHAPT_004186 [Fusarium lateritium]